MSEYQYFGFAAVDRRLSQAEQAELRRYSSRARITTSSFCNEYHWGNFKGDADDWMEGYFDIHVYFTNWGTRVLMLRLPAQSLPGGGIGMVAQHGNALAAQFGDPGGGFRDGAGQD